MACGCPVVSTRCGGPEEFVSDDQTGYLVDFDARQLADAITRVVSDRSLRERLSANAVALVREEYSTEIEKSKFRDQFNTTF
jgi:glycosyltransferase involved in cell wall biosynthesis